MPVATASSSTKIIDMRCSAAWSTKIVDSMTPAQCRAARGLLEITQSQLARAGRPRALDGRRLRERPARSFPGSHRSYPSRFGSELGSNFIMKTGAGKASGFESRAVQSENSLRRVFLPPLGGAGLFAVADGNNRLFRIDEFGSLSTPTGYPALDVLTAVMALEPVAVEGFGDHPELDDKIAGEVLGLDFSALFPPRRTRRFRRRP